MSNMRLLAAAKARRDIELVYENHAKPSVWKYADFSHPIDIFFETIGRLRSISINFDTGNITVFGDDP